MAAPCESARRSKGLPPSAASSTARSIEGFARQEVLGHYRLAARKDGVEILALWRCGGTASIPMPPGKVALGIEGEPMDVRTGQPLTIGESTVYLVDV